MIVLLSLAVIGLWASIGTVVTVQRDGYRAVPVNPVLVP